MNILSIEHLTKSYGTKVLFDDISFHVGDKQKIGLIGVNGTGKSTLLRVIAGLESADDGRITHANDFRVEYLAQEPKFEDGVSVLEAIFSGDAPIIAAVRDYEQALLALERNPDDAKLQARLFAAQQRVDALQAWDSATEAKTVLSRLGITEYDKPVAALSGGQRKRVALARALIQPADLLILDEPTNHIDNETAQWLERFLTKWNGALLLVTHDRYFLDRVTNRMFELHHGKLHAYEGNYAYFLEKKAEREEREAASEDKRQNLLRRELAWLRRGAKARTTKQKARIERAEDLMGRNVDAPDGKLDVSLAASRLGRKVIELHDVAKAIDGRTLFRDLSYIVMPGDRVGIIGPNGSGKSTLLNVIAGRLSPDAGSVDIGPTVKLGYYTQEHAEMDGKQRAIEYIQEAAEIVRTSDGDTITASQMLERFLFQPAAQWTPISRLSGGERRRLYLLRILMEQPNVLLLDEPTNDFDIATLSVLEDYLERFPGAVITVSHDRYFLDRTVDRLFAFEGTGKLRRYDGAYTEYLEARESELEAERQSAALTEAPGKRLEQLPREQAVARKLSFKEQKEWDDIEGVIAALEAKAAELQAQIAQAGSDVGEVQRLYDEQKAVSERLDNAMNRWTELSELVERIETARK